MKEFVVKYNRPSNEIEKKVFGTDFVNDTKWFTNYNTALKFAKKNNTKVYNGYDLIAENQQKLRSGKIIVL